MRVVGGVAVAIAPRKALGNSRVMVIMSRRLCVVFSEGGGLPSIFLQLPLNRVREHHPEMFSLC